MFSLALRNLLRQKSRTAVTALAIISGVVALILSGGFVQDIFTQLGEALIHSRSGHLQVYRQGFYEAGSRTPEKYLISNPESLRNSIAARPEVADVMARIQFAGLLNNNRTDWAVIGEGVQPDKEARLGSSLKISQGRQLKDTDAFGILLGEGVAKALKLKPGDHVTLLANAAEGALNSLDFEVVGVFQSFSSDYDARAVRIALPAAQELLLTSGVNALVISLHKTSDTGAVGALLKQQFGQSGYEIKNWTELNDFYEKTVIMYRQQFGVLQFIILVMVLLSVANSINMSVFERLGEFGTMMALGNRGGHVFRLILTESALLGLVSAMLGVIVGTALAMAISAIGIPMPPPPNANLGFTGHIKIMPSVLVMAYLVGFTATILGALLPASRVSKTPVLDALRANV
jgi:putative ABC transport system permease protein